MRLRTIAKLERLNFSDEIIQAFDDAVKDFNLEGQEQYIGLVEQLGTPEEFIEYYTDIWLQSQYNLSKSKSWLARFWVERVLLHPKTLVQHQKITFLILSLPVLFFAFLGIGTVFLNPDSFLAQAYHEWGVVIIILAYILLTGITGIHLLTPSLEASYKLLIRVVFIGASLIALIYDDRTGVPIPNYEAYISTLFLIELVYLIKAITPLLVDYSNLFLKARFLELPYLAVLMGYLYVLDNRYYDGTPYFLYIMACLVISVNIYEIKFTKKNSYIIPVLDQTKSMRDLIPIAQNYIQVKLYNRKLRLYYIPLIYTLYLLFKVIEKTISGTSNWTEIFFYRMLQTLVLTIVIALAEYGNTLKEKVDKIYLKYLLEKIFQYTLLIIILGFWQLSISDSLTSFSYFMNYDTLIFYEGRQSLLDNLLLFRNINYLGSTILSGFIFGYIIIYHNDLNKMDKNQVKKALVVLNIFFFVSSLLIISFSSISVRIDRQLNPRGGTPGYLIPFTIKDLEIYLVAGLLGQLIIQLIFSFLAYRKYNRN